MVSLVHLTPLDPRYPSRLRGLADAPASITVSGGSTEAAQAVAIVGSRNATAMAASFAHELACTLAKAGVVVISGGARGIDSAAHRGALSAEGRTWVVAGTGHRRCFPPENEGLFDTVAQGPGAMIWPFGPAARVTRGGFRTRNRYLVAMSDAVVVVQAGWRSGAVHAGGVALRTKKPLWVVPAAPWLRRFEGSLELLERGGRALTHMSLLLRALGLAYQNRTLSSAVRRRLPARTSSPPCPPLSNQESKTLEATSSEPRHTDTIAASAGLSPQATTAALLTLALENVLVEGPPGFFRRRDGHNR